MSVGRGQWSRFHRLASISLLWLRRHLSSGLENRAEYSLRPTFGPTLPSWQQFRLLPKVLSATERQIALSLFVLVLVSGLALGWRQYENKTETLPQTGGEYSEGIVGNPTTANPLLATSDAAIDLAFLTHRGLFKSNEKGELVPDLAASWNLSEDQKTYFITLHQGLVWSDGEPLTAADVIFTFASTQEPKLGSPLSASFKDVVITTINDGLTVSFTLKEPYAPFVYALTIGLIPKHIWQNIPYELWSKAEANLKTVGSGPFRFNSLARDGQGNLRSYSLEPNPYSHDGQPFLHQLNLRFYPDQISALEALKQGTIDGLGDISRMDKAGLNSKRFVVYDINLPQYTAIFYNPNNNSALKIADIRQALSYGISRQSLIQSALSGQAQPATGPFTFGEIKSRTAAQAITFDPTKSVQLLTGAGYSRSETDQIFKKDNEPLAITLTFVDNEEQLRVAEEIKKQWQAIGVVVTLQPVLALNLQTEVINQRNYQALLTSEMIGLDPDPYPFWHSSQIATPGLNLAQFQNHEADQLIVEARQTTNFQSRIEKYVRFQEILRQESPATFLYSLNYSYAQNFSIKGFAHQIMGQPAERFLGAATWYKKTLRSWAQN